MTKSVTFVFANEPGASQRQKELNRSKALSHAAQVAHSRKKKPADERQNAVRHGKSQYHILNGPYERIKIHDPAAQDSARNAEHLALQPFKGNSDPFGVWHVQITPQITEIMRNYRQFAIPGVYSDLIPQQTLVAWSERRRKTEVANHTSSFDDRAAALSSLHLTMTIMAIHVPNAEVLKSDLRRTRIQAFEAIKAKMAAEGMLGAKLFQAFIHLYLAFVQQNDIKNALIYGKSMRQLLDRFIVLYGDSVVVVEEAMKGCYLDVITGFRFRTHTVLGMERFLREYFEPIRGLLEPLQPSFRANLHPFISSNSDSIRRLFIQSRESVYLFTQRQLMSIEHGPWNWVFGHAIVLQCQFIDYLADTNEMIKSIQGKPHAQEVAPLSHLLIKECLVQALVTLFAAKYQNKSEMIYWIPPSEHLNRLEASIYRTQNSLKWAIEANLSVRHEEEALLWACYIAALVETQYLALGRITSMYCFEEQRHRVRVTAPGDIKDVLSRFLYLPDFMHYEMLEQLAVRRALPAREVVEVSDKET